MIWFYGKMRIQMKEDGGKITNNKWEDKIKKEGEEIQIKARIMKRFRFKNESTCKISLHT